MEYNFCRRCGGALTLESANHFSCPNGHTLYRNPLPTTGVFFLTADNELLLSVRGEEPHKGKLDAFGGYVDGIESLEQALVRELREELSLEPDEYEPPQFLLSAYAPYPYQGEILPLVSTLFWSRLKTKRQLIASDDVAAIHQLPLHSVDFALLGGPDIQAGIQKLQAMFPAGSTV